MKKLIFILVLIPLLGISKGSNDLSLINATNTHSDFYQVLNTNHLNTTGNGSGYGSVSISNDNLTIAFGGGWTPSQVMRTGVILNINTSPSLPDMELGPILFSANVPSSTGYFAKIENNNLMFYSVGQPTVLTGCYFSISIDLSCVDNDTGEILENLTWYLDDDLDGLGDSQNYIVKCTKPVGNYILDNTDLCPDVYGSGDDCTLLVTTMNQKNFIRKTLYKVPTLDGINDLNGNALNHTNVMVNTIYYDGLGRPIQQIANKQSNTGKDIITHIEYDGFGRQIKEYLPYVKESSLDFDDEGKANTLSFYNSTDQTLTGNPHFETTGNPYSDVLLESSPRSLLLEQAAPGNSWEMNLGKTIKYDYLTNKNEDKIVKFKVITNWSATEGLYTTSLIDDGFHVENQLYKTVVKDENWASGFNHTTEEFKNKQDQLVLKRSYNNEGVHDTYYVYDIFGNLTFVIPPKVDARETLTQSILDGLCYQYKYDYRNRLAEKKQPGKTWEYIVYDKLNRVVATGPTRPPFSNLTNHGWSITKYDQFNRPILSGWMSSSSTINSALRKTMQDARNLESVNFSELRNETTTDITIMGITYRYSNTAWPTSGYHVLTVTYYDDYNYPDSPIIPPMIENQQVYYDNTRKPMGLVTGSWTRVLRTSTSYRNETSYTLYDIKSRPLRVFNRNGELGTGGYTQVDTKFDFSGKVERTVSLHKRINSETPGVTTKDFYTYSDQDRLVKHIQQINSGTPQLITYNSYGELGNLISKKVGGIDETAATSLQKVDYKYNVRGWLKEINEIANLQSGSDPLDLFAFKINYNTVENDVNETVKSLYNGNISEIFWKSASDNNTRSYSFKYDHLNRLNEALFHKNDQRKQSYDEKITEYDKNGNIMFLFRNGNVEETIPAIEIDDLTYVYKENSNQLLSVIDNSNSPSGFKDWYNSWDDYDYDDFGNLIKDYNKGISDNIVYNHLNLPTKIIFAGIGQIEYVYNALGQKREKIVTEGSTVTITKYMDGYQYENNVLKFFPHAEGYVIKEGSSTYRHVFSYTDHLGNVRLSYCDLNLNGTVETNEILEENHYYPFGLKHQGYNEDTSALANKYKYNGKEWQDELGLNFYDYGARNYDVAIGRWFNIDPLAEQYEEFSPYNYTLNNPVYFIDPNGEYVTITASNGTKHAYVYVQGRNYEDIEDDYLRDTLKSLDQLYSSGAMNIDFGNKGKINGVHNVLQEIMDDKKNEMNILFATDNGQVGNKIFFNNTEGNIINKSGASKEEWDNYKKTGKLGKNLGRNSATALLGHELIHAWNRIFDFGKRDPKTRKLDGYGGRKEDYTTRNPLDFTKRHYSNGEEKYTTTLANQINRVLKEDERWDHRGTAYPTESPLSTKPKTVKPK